ncbi:hypothetical protein GGI04_002110 [Coemansia thaxteri]|nr:hypothetical protein GGI04_002110 [Coemansia thaxteri]KAJ2472006.1 hypothetical protein GGI02_001887 [Coemansia sp. RSA 2322]
MAPGKVETINFYDGSLSPKQAFQVYGWGTTRTGDSSSTANSLLTQTVYVSNPSDCQVIESNYKDADGPQICANNHYNIGVDVCQGDSGTGTTVFSNKTPYYSGLVSYGTNAAGDATCGEDGSFGMYTNVYYYKSWIESATGLKYMSGPNSIPVTTTSPPEPKPTSCFLFFFFCG